jgi:hypothetical protein
MSGAISKTAGENMPLGLGSSALLQLCVGQVFALSGALTTWGKAFLVVIVIL